MTTSSQPQPPQQPPLPPWPQVDFSEFGAIESVPLSRIQKLTGGYLSRNATVIPHVTHHDEVDITALEALRERLRQESGTKPTPLPFLVKALARGLVQYPQFNASLDAGGEHLIMKKYCHIGIAVDTPKGLLVPVLRDCDSKDVAALGAEIAAVSLQAREKGLPMKQMVGGCITISSLGGIGGTAFTPIVNAPEVAILGVSKSSIQPVWNGKEFAPKLMLPLSLSYDHRVIDGALAARFTTYLSQVLADMRRVLL